MQTVIALTLEFLIWVGRGLFNAVMPGGWESSAERMWRRVEWRLRLRPPDSAHANAAGVEGVVEGFDLHLSHATVNLLKRSVVVVEDPREEIPRELTLAPREGAEDKHDDAELRSGDRDFDVAFRISGPPSSLVALSDEARRDLLRLRSLGEVRVSQGALVFQSARWSKGHSPIVAATRMAISAARGLRVKADEAVERFAAGALDGPSELRRQNLEALFQFGRQSAVAISTAARLLGPTTEPSLRLLAARIVDDADARAMSRELMLQATCSEGWSPDQLRWALGDLTSETIRDFAAAALRRENQVPAVQVVTVEAIGRLNAQALLPDLLRLTKTANASVLAACANALSELGDGRAEPALLARLDDADDEGLLAIFGTLGKLGSVDAVEPLLNLHRGSRVASPLKRAAKAAVAAIQERAGDAVGGELSLAAHDGGQLSLAAHEPQGGELSSTGIGRAETTTSSPAREE